MLTPADGTNSINIRTTGHEKTSVTVVFACQADGQKLPPLVIFKRKTILKEKFPSNIIIKTNSKGWMDEKLMIEWLKEAYVKWPDGFFHIQQSLLVFDSIRAHITDTMKVHVQKTNWKLAVIPGGLTKNLQPLDIGINRSFKLNMRNAWEKWMTEGEHSFTKTGQQRRASYSVLCQWIVDAWKKISPSIIS